jgi:hypothetical protein
VADRRFNAKLILPDGTEKPSLIVYFPPTLTGEEVEDIGRKVLAVFSGQVLSDVEDEEGRGTTTEDMLDAGLLDSDGVDLPSRIDAERVNELNANPALMRAYRMGFCDGRRPDASAWWALVMGAAASIEDAANCLRDPDAKKQADGAAKHYREAAQKLMAAPGVDSVDGGQR